MTPLRYASKLNRMLEDSRVLLTTSVRPNVVTAQASL